MSAKPLQNAHFICQSLLLALELLSNTKCSTSTQTRISLLHLNLVKTYLKLHTYYGCSSLLFFHCSKIMFGHHMKNGQSNRESLNLKGFQFKCMISFRILKLNNVTDSSLEISSKMKRFQNSLILVPKYLIGTLSTHTKFQVSSCSQLEVVSILKLVFRYVFWQ